MKAKILVVDDMPEMLVMMTELLSGAGYNVLAASTFEDGKHLADGANPDLMLIDVRLGAYNGLHLAVREHADHPTRPMIVMSGYADPVIQAEAKSQGAEFLEKPIEPHHLLALIERLLAQRNTSTSVSTESKRSRSQDS